MNADIREVESVLAGLLDAYAGMREKYIHGDPEDFHSLRGSDRDLSLEVASIRKAAFILREHRHPECGMGLPVYLWDEWERARLEADARLDELVSE